MYKEELINLGEVLSGASNFISSILNSKFIITLLTSWPLAIVIVVLLLRKGLLNKLGRLISLKYKDIELNFQEELARAKESLGSVVITKKGNISTQQDEEAELQSIKKIAKESPEDAILASWLKVDKSIKNLLIEKGYADLLYMRAYKRIKFLEKENIIDRALFDSINHIRTIKSHLTNVQGTLNYKDALSYYELCKSIIDRLEVV